MKRITLYSILVLSLCTSCTPTEKWGVVEHYDSFLCVKENTTSIQKNINLEWSDDVYSSNKESELTLALVDNDYRVVSSQNMQVSVDGKVQKENIFTLSSHPNQKNTSAKLAITFLSNAPYGKYRGYVKVQSAKNLDRVNDEENLASHPIIPHPHWEIQYKHVMNPLAKTLMWIGIAILSVLGIWFVVLKPFISPTFGTFSKAFTILENNLIVVGQKRISLKGYREYHLTPHKPTVKQSRLNKIFLGEIGYYVVPQLKTDLILKPKSKHSKYCYIGGNYTIPSPMLQKNGNMVVLDKRNKIEIKIN